MEEEHRNGNAIASIQQMVSHPEFIHIIGERENSILAQETILHHVQCIWKVFRPLDLFHILLYYSFLITLIK
jgi:hypothetical protein